MSVETGVSRLTDDDLYLFNEGSHYRLYDKLGSHLMKVGETEADGLLEKHGMRGYVEIDHSGKMNKKLLHAFPNKR